jgi:hypothetical protein
MKEDGLFESDARQRTWLDSKSLIEPLNPAFAERYRESK